MKDNAALLSAVARLLNYLKDRDVADEIQTAGNVPVMSWKSEEFRKCIRQTEEVLERVKDKVKHETVLCNARRDCEL